jgi:hypothetical protein
MRSRKLAPAVVITALCLGSAGCRQQLVVESNDPPVADARAVDPATDMPTETMIEVAYSGTPVTITLDGSASRDAEGSVARYRWLSSTVDSDAGLSRVVPAGQTGDWPADTERVDVMLEEGEWVFNLWVVDDEGLVSKPDQITVKVGGADPAAECVDQVADVVSDPCKTCICSIESCQPMVIESGCDGPCWELIQCIGRSCPDFQAMAAMMDFSCLTTNCMAQYTATMGGTTPMGATPAGACARMCPAECSSAMM